MYRLPDTGLSSYTLIVPIVQEYAREYIAQLSDVPYSPKDILRNC